MLGAGTNPCTCVRDVSLFAAKYSSSSFAASISSGGRTDVHWALLIAGLGLGAAGVVGVALMLRCRCRSVSSSSSSWDAADQKLWPGMGGLPPLLRGVEVEVGMGAAMVGWGAGGEE